MSLDAEIAVLTGLARRIDRGAAALPVHDPKSLDAAPEVVTTPEAVTKGADR